MDHNVSTPVLVGSTKILVTPGSHQTFCCHLSKNLCARLKVLEARTSKFTKVLQTGVCRSGKPSPAAVYDFSSRCDQAFLSFYLLTSEQELSHDHFVRDRFISVCMSVLVMMFLQCELLCLKIPKEYEYSTASWTAQMPDSGNTAQIAQHDALISDSIVLASRVPTRHLFPDGPSTHCLRFLTPKCISCMVFGPRNLKYRIC